MSCDNVRSLRMVGTAVLRWRRERHTTPGAEIGLSDRNGRHGSFVKAPRLFQQSAMLALAAWPVFRGQELGRDEYRLDSHGACCHRTLINQNPA